MKDSSHALPGAVESVAKHPGHLVTFWCVLAFAAMPIAELETFGTSDVFVAETR
jgi:hypothetical protein